MKKSLDPDRVKFFGIVHDDNIIASGLYYTFGETATDLHGGSDYTHRALMAPYMLHWEAIKYFKSLGLKRYDFWGIDEEKWPGVTRFKTRFGGEVKDYPGAYVKILKPFWFNVYKVAKQ